MQLSIDHVAVEVNPGESLLSVIRRHGMDDECLSRRPVAASMAGSYFSLNYVPVRNQEEHRRAIRLSKGDISLIRMDTDAGMRIYERSLLFIFLLAMRRLHPDAKVHVDYALGQGIHCTIQGIDEITPGVCAFMEEECRRIVEEDHPFMRERMDIDDAIEFFAADGQQDKVDLLEWRNVSYFDVYEMDGMKDYFYGEMVPSTGYVSVFSIIPQEQDGILLQLPDRVNPEEASEYIPMPRFNTVFHESSDWGILMDCGNVADLNAMVRNGSIRRLVRINEALHEKRYAQIADEIIHRGAKAVLLAGPSSSGKTTSANRLCIQLQIHGKKPILISLDDYYIDRDRIPFDENGKQDLEHINTIDTALFRKDLRLLLEGKTVQIPRFDFPSGKRVMDYPPMQAEENTVFVIEGLHALNPSLMPEDVAENLIFRLYVSALTTLNLDNHNRISTSQIRLLRRMVRDFETRNTSVEETIAMWPSVRSGEEKWIFPFQENADAIFNSSLVYEPVVLKRHIFSLLQCVRPGSKEYSNVKSIVKFLNYFLEADLDDEIPPTSILREFIGGNTFYR